MTTQEVIDIGEYTQLFVDDYLIDSVTGLEREMHSVEKHPENPLILPELPFESKYKFHYTWDNGSVIYDPRDEIYRAYFSAAMKNTLYAESDDGILWRKPDLNNVEYAGTTENNILLEDVSNVSVTFNMDDPTGFPYRLLGGGYLARSKDGIHWEEISTDFENVGDSGACVYDPYEERHINIAKDRYPIGKIIQNPLTSEDWGIPIRVLGIMTSDGQDTTRWSSWEEILRPDSEDHQKVKDRYPGIFVEGWHRPWLMKPEFREAHEKAKETGFLDRLNQPPQKGFHHMDFMNLIIIPYHNLYIGMLQVLHSSAQVMYYGAKGSPRPDSPGQDGTMDVQLICSRDLEHWERLGSREAFLPLGDIGDWDQSMVMPFTSNKIVRDGDMWIYYGGSRHSHMPNSLWNTPKEYPNEVQGFGLATIRKDGFVSLDAGDSEGTLTTQPVRFDGERLVINADAKDGYVEVEILTRDDDPVSGYERKNSQQLQSDKIHHTVSWNGGTDLSSLKDKPVKIRFYLQNASLYTFRTTS